MLVSAFIFPIISVDLSFDIPVSTPIFFIVSVKELTPTKNI